MRIFALVSLQVAEGDSHNVVERMKMQNRLAADVKEGKAVEAQRRIYIALIPPEDHDHRVTAGRVCIYIALIPPEDHDRRVTAGRVR